MSDAMREALATRFYESRYGVGTWSNRAHVAVFAYGETEAFRDADIALAPQPALEATDDPYDPSPHCPLDACRREGCTRHAHMCLSKQPAAPSPAALSPATAEAERIKDVNKKLDEPAFAVAWQAFQNTEIDLVADSDDETCRCLHNAIAAYLSAAPSPALEPTLPRVVKATVVEGLDFRSDVDLSAATKSVASLYARGEPKSPALSPATVEALATADEFDGEGRAHRAMGDKGEAEKCELAARAIRALLASPAPSGEPITTEQLDQLQFGKSLHERPPTNASEAVEPGDGK